MATAPTARAESEILRLTRVRSLVRTGAARTIRLSAGLSLRELAREVGCAAPTILRWERQDQVPRGALALRYGEALDALMGRR